MVNLETRGRRMLLLMMRIDMEHFEPSFKDREKLTCRHKVNGLALWGGTQISSSVLVP